MPPSGCLENAVCDVRTDVKYLDAHEEILVPNLPLELFLQFHIGANLRLLVALDLFVAIFVHNVRE